MNSSYSYIHWEEEKIQNWNQKNHSLPTSIARVYEDTKIGRQAQTELQPSIVETLFMECIPNCDICSGYIVIPDTGHRYKCGCIHHSLVDSVKRI